MKRIASLPLAQLASMLAPVVFCASVVSVSRATPIDSAADHVLGQSDLQSNFTPSFPEANTLRGPTGVAIDSASGRAPERPPARTAAGTLDALASRRRDSPSGGRR